MSWWKTQAGDYFNPAHLGAAFSVLDDGVWRIGVTFAGGDGTTFHLSGTWATQAEAQEAIRQLVHGFDPASVTDPS